MTDQPDRLAIIGDVHGDVQRLCSVLDSLAGSHLDLIFVGDYVNRGPDTRAVLDRLGAAKQDLGSRLTLLRGNHEQALLDFLTGGDARSLIAHGGVATVRSYLPHGRGGFADFRAAFPDEHRDLLAATVDYYETDELLVTHAGFNPSDISSRRPHDIHTGFREMFEHVGPWPRPLTVCGHFVQRGHRPYLSESLICIDTGCGSAMNAPLTVLYWPSRTTRAH